MSNTFSKKVKSQDTFYDILEKASRRVLGGLVLRPYHLIVHPLKSRNAYKGSHVDYAYKGSYVDYDYPLQSGKESGYNYWSRDPY